VEGGITFREIDPMRRNIPAEMAEAIRAAQTPRKKK